MVTDDFEYYGQQLPDFQPDSPGCMASGGVPHGQWGMGGFSVLVGEPRVPVPHLELTLQGPAGNSQPLFLELAGSSRRGVLLGSHLVQLRGDSPQPEPVSHLLLGEAGACGPASWDEMPFVLSVSR